MRFRMRNASCLIISGLLITTFITFFLLRNNSNFPLNKPRIQNQLQKLNVESNAEYRKSQQLTQKIVEILKLKITAPIDTKVQRINIVPFSNEQLSDLHAAEIIQNDLEKAPPNRLKDDTGSRYDAFKRGGYVYPKNSVYLAFTSSTSTETPTLTRLSNGQPVIPILVFACNRKSISGCLDNLIQYRPSMEQFPIIVSQDCRDEATKNVILSYKSQVVLIEQPDQSDIYVPPKDKKFKGYYKIARHYGWALNTTFQRGYEFVVIVEDDLNVAPDFYEYFLGTHSLLMQDKSLWCVSAWNDNGKDNLIDTSHPELLYRTDFFPGLGWMLTRELWQELSVKWPKSFWDDWIRHPNQRKDRVCIRPEVPRTRTFGKIGVSNGLFFDKHLKYIKLSEDFVQFTKMNLSFLLKDNYDNTFLKDVYKYPLVTFDELRRNLISKDGPVRMQYTSRVQYKRITKMLGLMDDFKSGVPRTAYHGVVSFFYNKRRIFLAPNANWKGYDPSWS